MAVSRRLRFEILRRDNHTCRYCGRHAPDVPLTVDHVLPKALGGTDEPGNLVTACDDCNSGKSATPPDAPLVADVAADAVRWAAAMKQAASLQAEVRAREQRYAEAFVAFWDDYSYGKEQVPVPMPDDWEQSVLAFYRADLGLDEVLEAVDIAMRNQRIPPSRTWRYFCGICWRRLAERRDIAASLLQAEEAGPDGT